MRRVGRSDTGWLAFEGLPDEVESTSAMALLLTFPTFTIYASDTKIVLISEVN